jgi:hypothetical protein
MKVSRPMMRSIALIWRRTMPPSTIAFAAKMFLSQWLDVAGSAMPTFRSSGLNGQLTAESFKNEHPYGRGQPDVATGFVDLDSKTVDRLALGFGDVAEGAPERILQRDAGAVAAQAERTFDRSPAHSG